MSTLIDAVATRRAVGQPLDRIDGHAKVTGAARYAADAPIDAPLHAVIVQSTIACGRIVAIDERATRAVAGVVEVLTYRNAPRIPALPFDFSAPLTEEHLQLMTAIAAISAAQRRCRPRYRRDDSVGGDRAHPMIPRIGHINHARRSRANPGTVELRRHHSGLWHGGRPGPAQGAGAL